MVAGTVETKDYGEFVVVIVDGQQIGPRIRRQYGKPETEFCQRIERRIKNYLTKLGQSIQPTTE